MTKPAAVFCQIGGVLFAFAGAGLYSNGSSAVGGITVLIGLVLFFSGGRATRQRIAQDQKRD